MSISHEIFVALVGCIEVDRTGWLCLVGASESVLVK